jgi:uncharacterized membrane protein
VKGNILGFDPDSNTGAISGHDGVRYDFVSIEWRGQGRPSRGETVDFLTDGQRATQIFPLAARYDAAEGANANLVYILYLVSLVAGITSVVGLIMAYVNRAEAPEWVQTHYRFQIRTFWIMLLFAMISIVTMIVVVGFFFLVFTVVWFIVRCAKGMQQLSRGAPYENPATWMW